jgi:two-component system nitrate/nitrite response regulator NarL
MSVPGRVLVVDDHDLWRIRIRAALQDHPRWSVIAEASDGLGAIQKAKDLRPDVILLDVDLPALNGLVAASRILAADPQSKILFISEPRSPDIVETALRTGARGYLLKSDAHRLLTAIEAVSEGKPFVSEGLKGKRGT